MLADPKIAVNSEPDIFFQRRNQIKVGQNISLIDGGDIFFSELQTLTVTVNLKWVRENSRLDDIEGGLDWVRRNFREQDIKSLAMPALGCGLGGLDWKDVGPLMCRYLHGIGIPVAIYLPRERSIPPQYLKSLSRISSCPDKTHISSLTRFYIRT